MNKLRTTNHELRTEEKGQVLVGFLLLMVIGMSITLSLISRTTTDIRTTTTTEQSSRAYNAAEAGIEEALKKIEGGTQGNITGQGNLGTTTVETQTNYNYSVMTPPSTNKAFVFPSSFLAEEVTQVWLADYQDSNLPSVYLQPRIKVLWGNYGTNRSDTNAPGLEITLVYRYRAGTGKDGQIEDKKWYYRPSNAPSGFNSSDEVDNTAVGVPADQNNLAAEQKFAFSLKDAGGAGLNLEEKIEPGDGNNVFNTVDPLLLRFRMLYNTSTPHLLGVWPMEVVQGVSVNLPAQGQEIISTGTSLAGPVRKISVFRVYPTTNSLLDYALFSGSRNMPLKK